MRAFFRHSYALLVVLATALGAAAAMPTLTIGADPPLSPRDMLSTPFTVTNGGTPFPVRNVTFSCQIDSLETEIGQEILNHQLRSRRLAARLAPGGVITGICAVPGLTGNVIGTVGRQQIVRVSIEVTYYIPLLPIHRTVTAGFRTIPGADHNLHWLRVEPIPIWKSTR